MIKLNTRKNKSSQYVVGGTVAIIILGVWISLPLMNNSSMSASVGAGNPFKSKVSDISSLGSDVSAEGSAPGAALSGEMINNPATSGEEILSSLFQSGPEDGAGAADSASASADVGAAPGPAGSSAAPYAPSAGGGSGPGGKLNAVASLGGSGGGSMTAGGTHGKFFGSGNQKADFAPAVGADLKKIASGPDKKGAVTAMLNNTQAQSKLAASAGALGDARGGAAAAFGGSSKGGATASLDSAAQQGAGAVGLEDGQATGNLKRNDPSLNKSKVTPPAVTPAKEVKDPNEEMKKMIIQLIIKAAMGMAFGA